jgi:3-oxoacyl-[acyl-carrier protein] reductase
VMNTHLKGSFLASQAAQKHMVQQKYGKIVFISSTSALGNRGQSNYSAAKMGLQGLARTEAIELGPFNINVNAIAPGVIRTGRLGDRSHLADQIALRREGTIEDCAKVVEFLATDLSDYVTGRTIIIDGGMLR